MTDQLRQRPGDDTEEPKPGWVANRIKQQAAQRDETEATGGPVMVSDWRGDLLARLRERLRPEILSPDLLDMAVYNAADVASEFIEPLQADLVAAERRILMLAAELDEAQETIVRQAETIARLKANADFGRLPLAEITTEHVTAYKAAYWRAKGPSGGGPGLDDRIRAGLKVVVASVSASRGDAIPAPPIKRETIEEAMEDDCPGDCGPGDHCGERGDRPEYPPEMREVPFDDAQEGDTVTVVGTIYRFGPPTGLGISVADRAFRSFSGMDPAAKAAIRITRPVAPLPTTPGSVGTATVQGRPGVRVMLSTAGDAHTWVSAAWTGSGRYHRVDEITDYVPLLDGQEES